MADDKLFPYQARVPVTADGALPSVDLLQYLNKLFKIVGGYQANTAGQLLDDLTPPRSADDPRLVFSAFAEFVGMPPDEPIQQPNDTAPPGAFFTPDAPVDARIQALEALVHQMSQDIEGLKQGVLI